MICIEPFATTGKGHVFERGEAEVFGARRKLKPPKGVDGKNIAKVIANADAPSPHKVLHWQLGRGGGARYRDDPRGQVDHRGARVPDEPSPAGGGSGQPRAGEG